MKEEKVGGRSAKVNDKKGDRDLEREIKNKQTNKQRRHFFVRRTT